MTLAGRLRKHAEDIATPNGAIVSVLRRDMLEAADKLGATSRRYDSTVARIAGNILSSDPKGMTPTTAVYLAREIVAEVIRTESKE